MATIFGQLGLGIVDKMVHDTAVALIQGDITGKLATTVNGLVTSSFGIVGDVLGIVRDITVPAPPPPGS